jgi:hypothetical protein
VKEFEYPPRTFKSVKDDVAVVLWTLYLDGPFEDRSGRATGKLLEAIKRRGNNMSVNSLNKILIGLGDDKVDGSDRYPYVYIRRETNGKQTRKIELLVDPKEVPFPPNPFHVRPSYSSQSAPRNRRQLPADDGPETFARQAQFDEVLAVENATDRGQPAVGNTTDMAKTVPAVGKPADEQELADTTDDPPATVAAGRTNYPAAGDSVDMSATAAGAPRTEPAAGDMADMNRVGPAAGETADISVRQSPSFDEDFDDLGLKSLSPASRTGQNIEDLDDLLLLPLGTQPRTAFGMVSAALSLLSEAVVLHSEEEEAKGGGAAVRHAIDEHLGTHVVLRDENEQLRKEVDRLESEKEQLIRLARRQKRVLDRLAGHVPKAG